MALYYPPVGFHFAVYIEGLMPKYTGIPDIGFQEASGLDVTINTEEYREGGENRFAHRLPGNISYPNLVLKRGLLIGSQLQMWFRSSIETFTFEPHDMNLLLLNPEHMPIQAWSFLNAYPVKWSVSGFNAQDNGIVVDSVEFSYQFSRRVDPVDLLTSVL
ncbi:MAG: phage tail protein [Bacteroidetes bacterium]|nr:phage tail protein [Bacteroidota bacterium]